jgi:hypothetical protein
MIDQYCYPVEGLKFDREQLKKDCDKLIEKLGFTKYQLDQALNSVYRAHTINLTHLPGLFGDERFMKFNGNHYYVESAGVKEGDFTEPLSELHNTYLKEVMNEIKLYHIDKYGTPFQGRCQLIMSRPGQTYSFHTDSHTKHRYHVPIKTDKDFWFFFKTPKGLEPVHMPADGRAWYLNPVDVEHTVAHLGSVTRMHLLMTSEL